VSVFTTKPFVGDIDADALPLDIIDKLRPVTPLAGILYNLDPSPINKPLTVDPAISTLPLTINEPVT
jgi:hypothetical protein